jgi:hypothetical protein
LNASKIFIQSADSKGGENYGWRRVEAGPPGGAAPGPVTPATFVDSDPWGLIGSAAYRGPNFPRMNSGYFYGRSGAIWTLNRSGINWVGTELEHPTFLNNCSPFFNPVPLFSDPPPAPGPFVIRAIGEGESGDLFVANYGGAAQVPGPPVNPCVPGSNGSIRTDILCGGIYRMEDDLTVFAVLPTVTGRNRLALQWQSAPGLSYRVQISSDLINWENFRAALEGNGGVLSVPNIHKSETLHRFFRVVGTPLKIKPQRE